MILGIKLPSCQANHHLPRRLAYVTSALSPALQSGPSEQIMIHKGTNFKDQSNSDPLLLISNKMPVALTNSRRLLIYVDWDLLTSFGRCRIIPFRVLSKKFTH